MSEAREIEKTRQKVDHHRKWFEYYSSEVERCTNIVAALAEQSELLARQVRRAESMLRQARGIRNTHDNALQSAKDKLNILTQKYEGAFNA